MLDKSVNTKIYTGGSIDHASERKFLAFIVPWLHEQNIPSIVLANIEIDGRQIDCIIATNYSVSVVEVKTSQLPIRGEINGPWARLSPSGEWKNYANAYQQVVDAKNRLRDAMHATKLVGDFYPDGYVVFTSPFPTGSQVTCGNFKAQVTTMDLLPSQIKTEGQLSWTIFDWEEFARKLNLTPTPLDQAVAGTKVREEFDMLERYIDAIVSEYSLDGNRWLPETEKQREELLNAAATDAGCFISGPSGCGKTLIAKWLAAKLAAENHPIFFIAAKNFSGSWADTLRKEIGLLADDAPDHLYRIVIRSDPSAYLIVDGINEFGAALPEALRGVRALAGRMGARLVVTSQDTKPEEFGGLRSVTIAHPSLELKQRIAQSDDWQITPLAQEILTAVGSGFEAELVGEIGGELKANASRLLLVDQYIRKRLGAHARAGSFAMRRLAIFLHEQISFSVAETTFDELMRAEGISFTECDCLFEAGLLIRRTGRVSFSHEMILNACAAFDLARTAKIDAAGLGQRLSTPILEPISGDIIAAIDNATICRAVLAEAMGSSLLVEAASGRFGPVATSTALDLLKETTKACVAEIRGARLTLWKEGDMVRIGWEDETRRKWSYAEEARLRAIGRSAAIGFGIDEFLNLCAEMDARLMSERQRWSDFSRQEKYPIRSQSFALTYYSFGKSIGFTTVAQSTQHGFEPRSNEEKIYPLRLEELTSGQLHFCLKGRRLFFDGDSRQLAEHLIFLFRKRFHLEPYHVQLMMLNSVGYTREAPQEVLDRLIEAINALKVNPGNWGINSSIIDALKILGALDDDAEGSRSQVKAELASALVDDEDAADSDLALSLYMRMFDHPFDTIYAEEIYDLDEKLRRRLYRRALQASDIRNSMSLSWLIKEVVSFGDPLDTCLLRPFTSLPSRTNPFVQEEWGAFAAATRFLGRHHAKLEPISATTPEESCLVEIRSLVHAIEAKRETEAENARLAWQRLHKMNSQLVVGCLSEVQKAIFEHTYQFDSIEVYPPIDLAASYSADCLAVSRRFIDEGIDAQFYHQVGDKESGLRFAFDCVGSYGDRGDVERLRNKSRAHPFARHALATLKQVDCRPG